MPVLLVPVLSRLTLYLRGFSSTTLIVASTSPSLLPAFNDTCDCLTELSFATRRLRAILRELGVSPSFNAGTLLRTFASLKYSLP